MRNYLVKNGKYELNPFNFFDELFEDNSKFAMKTDVKEENGNIIFNIDMPGYKKEDIYINVENGYLNVKASINNETEEKSEKFIRRERYIGSNERSYYVGDVNEQDIKAKMENGVLTIMYPKDSKSITEEKRIMIE